MHYAELKARTHYSFLRGASHPHEMMERAAELGLAAIAITDRNGVYGMPKAYDTQLIRAREGARTTQLIVGAEITVASHAALDRVKQDPAFATPTQAAASLPTLTLLARDRAGYGLMCRLITAAHAGKSKGEAHLPWEELATFLERFPEGRDGLFFLPDWELGDACGSGGLGATGVWASAVCPPWEFLKSCLREPERQISIPLVRHWDGLDARRTALAQEWSRTHGLRIVAVNDAHTHVRERQPLQDLVTAVRETIPLEEIGTRIFGNAERTLKSAAEMADLFKDLPDAIERTTEIAAQCIFSPRELRYRYPSEWIPQGETALSYLERLALEGAQWRYPEGIPPEVRTQLAHEFKLVRELEFADYFLTIWEIVQFARERGILCQGRGSAANSIICYCLGITAIDPVKMSLLFERFISAERAEPPDIDVDFEHERREEVIQHIYQKYGRDRAGMVSAIITYRSKSSLRDLAKALAVDPEELQKPPFDRFVRELRGFPRHLSIHSGGFTLSADPLIETVPIEPARMEGRTIVQWDKEDLATIGLLKVDVLALGMLTAIEKTFQYVHRTTGKRLEIATIPPDDPKTYAAIQAGDMVGVFQIESRAQMGMLRRLRPACFYDLVIEVAIVRPGPIVGEMVHPYLRRRRGQESPTSPDPRLDPILGRTLGVPLFQEQVMKMAVVMAGFTPGESDQLRRAIGAWRSSGQIEKMGQRLKTGLLASGLPEEFVERIFKQIQGFAEYGFPESHAASFALLAYVSAYLKTHYPAAFVCAVLNAQPMGFYTDNTLLEDAKRHGVLTLPVDVNASIWDSDLTKEGAVRVGFRVVNGMRRDQAEALLAARREHGPFKNLWDFLDRVRFHPRVLHALAMGGAFSVFGLSQRDALWTLLEAESEMRARGRAAFSSQLSLFTGAGREDRAARPESRPEFPRLGQFAAVRAEFHAFGLSTRVHPMRALKEEAQERGYRLPALTSQSARLQKQNARVQVAGLVICRQHPHTAQGTTFATLEDEEGFVDLILHEAIFEKFRSVFTESPILTVTGRVQRDVELPDATVPIAQRAMSIIVESVEVPRVAISGPLDLRSRSYDFR